VNHIILQSQSKKLLRIFSNERNRTTIPVVGETPPRAQPRRLVDFFEFPFSWSGDPTTINSSPNDPDIGAKTALSFPKVEYQLCSTHPHGSGMSDNHEKCGALKLALGWHRQSSTSTVQNGAGAKANFWGK
jgi:hypothetical protein